MRTVKTTSGATAVQVVWSSRRGSREPGLAMADLFIGFAILILLSAAGVARKEDQALAAKRDVARLVTCADPVDRTLEFYHGGTVPKEEFVSPTEVRFVTKDPDGKDMGLGHIVLSFSDLDQALDFYLGTLRFTSATPSRCDPGWSPPSLTSTPGIIRWRWSGRSRKAGRP